MQISDKMNYLDPHTGILSVTLPLSFSGSATVVPPDPLITTSRLLPSGSTTADSLLSMTPRLLYSGSTTAVPLSSTTPRLRHSGSATVAPGQSAVTSM